MASRFLIYGLIDPRDDQLRYVGQTSCSLRARLVRHVYRARWGQHYRDRWIRLMGQTPDIVELEVCATRAEADEAERHFIAYFRYLGCRLTNLASGGIGGATRWGPHTVETKAKISAATIGKQKGRPKSVETRRRMSVAGRGKAHPWVLKSGRPVVDETGHVYASRREAARSLGIDVGSVSKSARLGWRVGGHVFREAV